MNIRHETLAALRKVRSAVIRGGHAQDGICAAVTRYMPEAEGRHQRAYMLVRDLFTKWPKYSGSALWPLPGGPAAFSASVGAGRGWDPITQAGKDRREALDFLIRTLEGMKDGE